MAAANNVVYSNFYLSNEIEDQYNSHLDLTQFCTIDNNLEGTAGMTRKVNVYSATSGTQDLAMGAGNSQTIAVTYSPKTYVIKLAQNEFDYYDEQAMQDDMLVPVGLNHMAVDMFNHVMADIYAEFKNAKKVVVCSAFGFDAFANAQSMLDIENLEGVTQFAFVNPADVAALRKALKDDLKYVEAFARSGYIGTVAGVNVFTKNDATAGVITMATPEAVTLFNKLGTEVEQDRDGNTRTNKIWSRKYYLAALTHEKYAVKIEKGTAAVSSDTSVDEDKTYYEADGLGYLEVTPATGDNPHTKGWYEITLA